MLKLTRRSFVLGAAGALVLAPANAAPRQMSARQAHVAAQKGELLLLDIRTRGEWQQTGIGTSAHAVSMHEPGFLSRLNELTNGDKSKPVALICAVGGRSKSVQRVLSRMGYSAIIDVPEGMIGGVYGPGWIKSDLPVKAIESQ